jgi:hypothetical protein
LGFGQDGALGVVAGKSNTKLAVYLRFVCGVGLTQGIEQATKRVYQRMDVVSAHSPVCAVVTGEGGQPGLCDGALLLHLLAPGHHERGIGARF